MVGAGLGIFDKISILYIWIPECSIYLGVEIGEFTIFFLNFNIFVYFIHIMNHMSNNEEAK